MAGFMVDFCDEVKEEVIKEELSDNAEVKIEVKEEMETDWQYPNLENNFVGSTREPASIPVKVGNEPKECRVIKLKPGRVVHSKNKNVHNGKLKKLGKVQLCLRSTKIRRSKGPTFELFAPNPISPNVMAAFAVNLYDKVLEEIVIGHEQNVEVLLEEEIEVQERPLYTAENPPPLPPKKTKRDMRRSLYVGEMPMVTWFKCQKCGYKATQRQSLQLHTINDHRDEKIEWFRCKRCDYRSTQIQHLKQHVISKHLNEVEEESLKQESKEGWTKRDMELLRMRRESSKKLKWWQKSKLEKQSVNVE